MMLLEKILQSQGFGSRKHCQHLIKSGAVQIDGQVITDVKFKIAEQQLKFQVFAQQYQYREKVYLALHKPQDYECSHQATHHFSVFDLMDELLLNRGVQCIGRLDQDTTGILLLTDDGQFLQALTHPKKHVPKVYIVETADPISPIQIEQLLQGVELRNEKGIYAASQAEKLAENKLSLTIHQGVYHQVKRMLAAVGNKVITLHRQQVGLLDLGQLEQGQYVYLNEQQIQAAKNQSECIEYLG